MRSSVGFDDFVRMLRCAAEQIRAQHEMLSKLDSVGGDGDHGTTMVRAMGMLEKAVVDCMSGTPQGLLNDVGWAIMGVDGGATGPLLGTFFSSMSEAVPADVAATVDARALAMAFETALAGVQRQTKAQVGDKTMIDALVPAVQTLRSEVDKGQSADAAMKSAAEAALKGAESTKALQARFGRARNIKEQSIGAQDPGATSISLIFKGFAEALAAS